MKIILTLDLTCLKVAGQDLVEFVYLKTGLSRLVSWAYFHRYSVMFIETRFFIGSVF